MSPVCTLQVAQPILAVRSCIEICERVWILDQKTKMVHFAAPLAVGWTSFVTPITSARDACHIFKSVPLLACVLRIRIGRVPWKS